MTRSKCSVLECSNVVTSFGLCGSHAYRRDNGIPVDNAPLRKLGPDPVVPSDGVTCGVPGCDGKYASRGLCSRHYVRYRKGRPDWDSLKLFRVPKSGKCTVEGCDNEDVARGWCDAHYKRWLQGREMVPTRKNKPKGQYLECKVEGCEKPAIAKKMCDMHHNRERIGMDLTLPFKCGVRTWEELDVWNPCPPGKDGYIRMTRGFNPNREDKRQSIAQHRLVMEEHLERILHPHETVHHINGIRHDNRLENLELWSSRHPSGQRVADKIEWAKDLLRMYDPESLNPDSH